MNFNYIKLQFFFIKVAIYDLVLDYIKENKYQKSMCSKNNAHNNRINIQNLCILNY